MYKATVENKSTKKIEETIELSTPYEVLTWLDYTFDEITYIGEDIKVSSPMTVSAYLCMLQGASINVRYKQTDEICILRLIREEKGATNETKI
jgi:hypothetical protein